MTPRIQLKPRSWYSNNFSVWLLCICYNMCSEFIYCISLVTSVPLGNNKYCVALLGIYWSYKGARPYLHGCQIWWHSWARLSGNICWECNTSVVSFLWPSKFRLFNHLSFNYSKSNDRSFVHLALAVVNILQVTQGHFFLEHCNSKVVVV